MTKCFHLFGWIGLALIVGSLLLGEGPASGTEAVSGAEAGSGARRACCPHCGCRLVPVCQVGCNTKKTTEYKYRCISEEMCIPGVTPICKKHKVRRDDCPDCCRGRCTVKEVKKLVKRPVTKEEPVRTCTVAWICPNGCNAEDAEATSTPSGAPAAPSPIPPAPVPMPPRPKTSGAAVLPTQIGSLRSR